MKLQITGSLSLAELTKKIEEIVESTIDRVKSEDDSLNITGWGVREADVTIEFTIEGEEEAQVMTVEHHEGQSEMFTWLVNTDEDTEVSNQEESMIDDWTAAVARDEELQFPEIESKFSEHNLDYESEEKYNDLTKIVYNFNQFNSTDKLVRVYQSGRLIQEYKLTLPIETDNTTEGDA